MPLISRCHVLLLLQLLNFKLSNSPYSQIPILQYLITILLSSPPSDLCDIKWYCSISPTSEVHSISARTMQSDKLHPSVALEELANALARHPPSLCVHFITLANYHSAFTPGVHRRNRSPLLVAAYILFRCAFSRRHARFATRRRQRPLRMATTC